MASVKVAVRVRPFNERELNMDAKCIVRMEGNKTIISNQKLVEIDNASASATTAVVSTLLHSSPPSSTPSPLAAAAATATTNLDSATALASLNPLKERFKEFVYDASYWSFNASDANFVSQQDVYNDLGRTTVGNAFDGYNACVCAYGQTGSGKSYSMMGATSSERDQGLIPRICKALFERIHQQSGKQAGASANSAGADTTSKGTTTTTTTTTSNRIEVSYLEIYNEKVRDLLRSSAKAQQNLKVREHPKLGVYVQDLSQHIVCNYFDIEELIAKGNVNRTTASTNMNDTSSRSHAIFTVRFAQAKMVENMPSETVSKMNLVDLAGSERADSTGATGLRLKEGGNINKSLLTFINVISTLADLSGSGASSPPSGNKHYIPYRDSVLTWLLKDSLGGNSKTVILAAISPADVNYVETLVGVHSIIFLQIII